MRQYEQKARELDPSEFSRIAPPDRAAMAPVTI